MLRSYIAVNLVTGQRTETRFNDSHVRELNAPDKWGYVITRPEELTELHCLQLVNSWNRRGVGQRQYYLKPIQ